ncbi:MAG: sodium-independent anion transporter [Bacteroidia bacterium]
MSDSVEILRKDINSGENEPDKLFAEEAPFEANNVILYEINGPLFFGAAQQFQEALINTNTKPEFVIIRLRYVPFIDTTGFHRFREIIKTFQRRGTTVVLSGVSESLKKDFELNDLQALIPENRIFSDINKAFTWINEQRTTT